MKYNWLGPGDFDRIQKATGFDRELMMKMLVPVIGAKLNIRESGEEFTVPLIGLKRVNGNCVMFSKTANSGKGGCAIHHAAPYLCSRLLACEHDAEDQRRVTGDLLKACLFDIEYGSTWIELQKTKPKSAWVKVNATYQVDWN